MQSTSASTSASAAAPVVPELAHAPTDSSTSTSGSDSSTHSGGLHLPHMHMPHPHMPHPHMPHPHMPQHIGASLAHLGMEVLEAAAYMGPGVDMVSIPPEEQVSLSTCPLTWSYSYHISRRAWQAYPSRASRPGMSSRPTAARPRERHIVLYFTTLCLFVSLVSSRIVMLYYYVQYERSIMHDP